MNFHDTKMGHSFFERQLPQLIRSIDALAAALGKPVQPVVLPVEADPEFLSKLYLGSAPQRQQNKQQKHKAKQSESGPQG